jgi:spore coat polysaccharide biosynthesis protein SpsF (cytidylyltransferase family)/sialic acid synthase SpsE
MYYIIEVANTHGGDRTYLDALIQDFESFEGDFGIKFQAFSPDTIALKDFEWYPVYENLYFNPTEWSEIICSASKTKDIWLDIFDSYGIEIFEKNQLKIKGIKFQSSVLQNQEVFKLLTKIDLTEKIIILNIAAQPETAIEMIIKKVNQQLKPKKIMLEIGFQSYPTMLSDCGLNKIETLKNKFQLEIVFADHTEGTLSDAITLPLVAAMKGASAIEKHVMLRGRETKYDYFSSISSDQFKELVEKISAYSALENMEFINDREIEYLHKSQMKPLLNKVKNVGDLIDTENDFKFRRTGQEGITLNEAIELQKKIQVLSNNKASDDSIKKEDFRPARVAAIIACRLKSSRLKEKALLHIGDLPSVSFCISHAMKFKNVQKTILATSTLEQDYALKDYIFSKDVIFFQGDPEDVISRYLKVCDQEKIDVIVRITADMPFVDPTICEILLRAHFEKGSDYTTAKKAAIGTNLEIINVSALRKIKSYFQSADYSEYMTWYFQNNPEFFKLQFVDLPSELVRDYRLTLDYDEDLQLFNKIDDYFSNKGQNPYTLIDVFQYLDAHPEVASINKNCQLKYKTDQALIDLLNEKTKMK